MCSRRGKEAVLRGNVALCFILLTISIAASAQTNFFPTLTVGDRTYTNVTIGTVTAADVTLLFPGGGARVALSNLPPDLQQQFGYDPDRAAELLATRARRRAAARQREVAAAAEASVQGPPRTLRVIEVDTSGTTPLCVTDAGRIWLQNLPRITITHLEELKRLQQQIRTLDARLQENTRALRVEEAMAPDLEGYPEWFVDALRAQRVREIRLRNLVTEQSNLLDQLAERHQQLLAEANRSTLVVAAGTSRKYLGYPIWKCLGIAPPPEEEEETNASTNAQPAEVESRTDLPSPETAR